MGEGEVGAVTEVEAEVEDEAQPEPPGARRWRIVQGPRFVVGALAVAAAALTAASGGWLGGRAALAVGAAVLVAAALCWRYRDRLLGAVVAVAAVIGVATTLGRRDEGFADRVLARDVPPSAVYALVIVLGALGLFQIASAASERVQRWGTAAGRRRRPAAELLAVTALVAVALVVGVGTRVIVDDRAEAADLDHEVDAPAAPVDASPGPDRLDDVVWTGGGVTPDCGGSCASLLTVPGWDVFVAFDPEGRGAGGGSSVAVHTVADGSRRWSYGRDTRIDGVTVDADAGRLLVTHGDAAVVLALDDGRELATRDLPGASCTDPSVLDGAINDGTELRPATATALVCGALADADRLSPSVGLEVVMVEVASGDVLGRSDLASDEPEACQVWPVPVARPTTVRWGWGCGPPALLTPDGAGGLTATEIDAPAGAAPTCPTTHVDFSCVENRVHPLDDDTVVLSLTWGDPDEWEDSHPAFDTWVDEVVAVDAGGDGVLWRTTGGGRRLWATGSGIVTRDESGEGWRLLSADDGRELASAPTDPLEEGAVRVVADDDHVYAVGSEGGVVVRDARDLDVVDRREGASSIYAPVVANGLLVGFFHDDPIDDDELRAYGG